MGHGLLLLSLLSMQHASALPHVCVCVCVAATGNGDCDANCNCSCICNCRSYLRLYLCICFICARQLAIKTHATKGEQHIQSHFGKLQRGAGAVT